MIIHGMLEMPVLQRALTLIHLIGLGIAFTDYFGRAHWRVAVPGMSRCSRSARYRDDDADSKACNGAPAAEIVEDEDRRTKYSERRIRTIRRCINSKPQKTAEDLSQVKARTNFNETAFFYPHLQTNEKGEIVIKFTIPEALTRWKMLGFAHTKDLKSGLATNHLVTQKDLMVVPNQPRFFRENDKMIFAVKVSSLVDNELTGQAQLEFFDALTMKPVDAAMKNINKVASLFTQAKTKR